MQPGRAGAHGESRNRAPSIALARCRGARAHRHRSIARVHARQRRLAVLAQVPEPPSGAAAGRADRRAAAATGPRSPTPGELPEPGGRGARAPASRAPFLAPGSRRFGSAPSGSCCCCRARACGCSPAYGRCARPRSQATVVPSAPARVARAAARRRRRAEPARGGAGGLAGRAHHAHGPPGGGALAKLGRQASPQFEAYRHLAPVALRVAQRVLGDTPAAEDVVQDLFLQLWRDPDSFDPSRGSLRAYVTVPAELPIDRLRAAPARVGWWSARRAATRPACAGVGAAIRQASARPRARVRGRSWSVEPDAVRVGERPVPGPGPAHEHGAGLRASTAVTRAPNPPPAAEEQLRLAATITTRTLRQLG